MQETLFLSLGQEDPLRIRASLMVYPEETQDEKTQETGPQVAEVYTQGAISMRPDSRTFPYTEKC